MKRLQVILVLIFAVLSISGWSQKDSVLQSLGYYTALKASKSDQKDSAIVLKIQDEVSNLRFFDPEKGEIYANAAYALSKKIGYKKGIATGLRLIGDMQMLQNKLDSSKIYIERSIDFSTKNNLQLELLKAYYSMGSQGFYEDDFDMALEYYFKADGIAKSSYPKESGGTANGIGLVFRVIGNDPKATEYFEEAYRLGKLYKDTSDIIQSLNNLGIIAKNASEFEKSRNYYLEGLELSELTGNLRRSGEYYYNLAVLYARMGDDDSSFYFMTKSADVTRLMGDKRGMAMDDLLMGEHYCGERKFDKALKVFLEAIEIGEELGINEVRREASRGAAVALYEMGRYKEGFMYLHDAINITDSMEAEKLNGMAMEMERKMILEQLAVQDSLQKVQFELEQQHQQKLNDEKIKSREILLWFSGGIIVLIFFGIYFLFRSRQKIKAKNQTITERNLLITQQKEEIEEVHKEITDSINYARRIQNTLISGNEEWDKISKDHYILFKPKDVVSGDFYWAYHSAEDNTSIWVTADCTGHGVPGAFMSMLGISFLNEIIIENGKRNGAEILDRLRSKIVKALTQKNAEIQQRDGMDMSICIWDRTKNVLEFTGANNGAYLIRKTEQLNPNNFDKHLSHASNGYSLAELPANKMPVGFQSDKSESFTSRIIDLLPGDLLVTYTDGYADQFGGEKGKKLKYKTFKEILLDIQTKPIKLHGQILEEAFKNWKGDIEQIDDVCIIGVRIAPQA